MGGLLEDLGLDGIHILVYAVNLVVLFIALYLLLFKPVKKMIKKRRDTLEAVYSENDRLNKEALTIKHKYEEKLEEKKLEMAKMSEDIRKAAEEKAAGIVGDANKQARAILDEAAEDIEREEQRLQNRFREETSELGIQIASAILAREVSEKDNDKIIDEAIAKWES